MKRLLLFIIILLLNLQTAFATPSANIHIKIKGAPQDNRYFLCIANIGCLSIYAAEQGKIYPIFHPFRMTEIYVTDANRSFRIYAIGFPKSCDVRVKESQTISIYGYIVTTPSGVQIHQLRCELR